MKDLIFLKTTYTNVRINNHLLNNETLKYVHDETNKPRIQRQRLNNSPHEECWQWILFHQLLHHDGQHFLSVN